MTEQPISNERLKKLAEGLSSEARELLLRKMANDELDPELRLPAEDFIGEIQALGEEDAEQISTIFQEFIKERERSLRKDEEEMDISERALRMIERAQELDPSLAKECTPGQAAAVLKAHGDPLASLVSEEEMKVELEVPPPEEVMDWISVPASEIPTDENGIPTRKAAKYGIGLKGPDGEIMRLYPLQVSAMRAMASKRPYRQFVEEYIDEIPTVKREYLEDLEGMRDALEAAGEDPERMAEQLVNKTLQDAYLQSLAMMVQEYPHGPQGIIDYYRDRETKAGLRYKRWMDEKTEALIKGLGRKMTDEMIEEGVYELVISEDGKEYLKLGPNYEAYYRERGLEPPV